ncbi:MAG: ferritin family protein [Schaedlerella sp.]|nr:ferritin family protein [Lachnospiraceae bacterium]MDY4202737.1 ferritin family protein [Schaedlerella sp.]
MNKNRIQKVEQPIIHLPWVNSMGVIGDPGCEGLGTYNMKVYAGTLEKSAEDDITLIAGDLVPTGNEYYYEEISALTEIIAYNDIYVLRGNHDTGSYMDYFGRKNYALLAKEFSVVVLDNAMRKFETEGLELLKQVLEMEHVHRVIIAFHIPVPNHYIRNSVSEEEFERLKEAYTPWKDKVKYLLCGHVHSRFEDIVDDIPLICTGGGGALIEDVSEEIRACDVEHHMVHFFMEEKELKYRFDDLSENAYDKERNVPMLKESLEKTVISELMAHLKYLMLADRAERRGMERISNLFKALAASEYHHARNFYSVIQNRTPFRESAEAFIPVEEFEYQYFYKMMEEYAVKEHAPLTKQAFLGAAAAEKVHAELLKEASAIEKFDKETVFVCPICGYVMAGDQIPDRCPVCGGPKRQFEVFQSGDSVL